MDNLVTQDAITLMISQAPNFVGFILLSYFLWRTNNRQLDMIEKLVIDCLEEDDKLSQGGN